MHKLEEVLKRIEREALTGTVQDFHIINVIGAIKKEAIPIISKLEKENSGLSIKLDNYQYEVDEGQKRIDQLKRENTELKYCEGLHLSKVKDAESLILKLESKLKTAIEAMDAVKTGAEYCTHAEIVKHIIDTLNKLKEN